MKWSNFYPTLGKIDQDKVSNTVFLSTGCVEGNCENGTGKYMTISFSNQGKTDEKEYANVNYALYSGTFSASDSTFNGTYQEWSVPVSMKKGKSSYATEDNKISSQNAKLISKGSFKKKVFSKNGIRQIGYVKNGMVEQYKWANKTFNDNIQSLNGFFQQDKLLYAHIVYYDTNIYDIKEFKGLVTPKGKPILGMVVTKIGIHKPYSATENQFQMEPFTALCESNLLLSVLKENTFQTTLTLGIADQTNVSFETQSNTWLTSYTTDFGFIMKPDGTRAETNYTGIGLFYSPKSQLFVGTFINGVAEGQGWLYVGEDHGGSVLRGEEHGLFGQFKNGKVTKGWYGAADSDLSVLRKRIVSTKDLADEWALLQKKAESGDEKAMFDLSKKYIDYDAPEPNQTKGLEWLEQSASKRYLPAIEKLVDLYDVKIDVSNMNDKELQKKREKQAYWASVVCEKDITLANTKTFSGKSYFQIYWGYYFSYFNHWYHEFGSSAWTNQPFVTLESLTPEKIKYYQWVQNEINKEREVIHASSVYVSNYTLQSIPLANNPNTKIDVVMYHYGYLPTSMEFSVSKFSQNKEEVNQYKITNYVTESLRCTFDQNDPNYKGLMSKRECRNGSLEYVLKDEGIIADYFFNLTPINKPELKVFQNWNRKGFDVPIDYNTNVIWAIFIRN